jgi:general secretion pathway protein M
MKLTESRIASRQGQLEEARRLQQEYFTLQRVLTTAEKKLAGTARGFSLFSFIEDITTRTGIRENLVSMRPQTPQVQGDFKEELVEIRLERIGLEQMVKFLHAIESADTTLQVKNVRIKPRFDNRTQLDTVLIVSSLQRTA